jgi:hypothetical protein
MMVAVGAGLPVDSGSFRQAGGQVAPLFESVEATFDDVALPVDQWIQAGRAPAAAPTLGAAGDLVAAFRDPHRPARDRENPCLVHFP